MASFSQARMNLNCSQAKSVIHLVIKRNRCLISLFSLLSISSALASEGSSIGVFGKTRQDIDYHLNTLGVSASLVTSVGLFRCDPAVLKGKTRIDSFNNIIGISDVREAEWKDFSAHDIECRYGAKWNAAEGVFKAGIGFRDYQGRTDDEPGGKDISIEGAGALLDYDSQYLDAKLEWRREIHDYTLKHQTSFGDYDSLIDATEDTYNVSVLYRKLYLDAKYVNGNKDNEYTTPLFPANRFRYAHTDIAIGLTFQPEENGLTLIAPIIGEGSYRGSFNPLTGDTGLKGVKMAGRIYSSQIDFSFVRHKGVGDRPYLPATEKLTEHIEATTVLLGIKKDGWKSSLEYLKSNHRANAAIAHPLYAAIVGGFGPFYNERAEDKLTLTISFPVEKKVTANLSLYHTARYDRQYTHPDHTYTENGGFIQFIFSE